MKVNSINSSLPSFKAHFYKIPPNISCWGGGVEILTDNKPYMGDDPYIVYLNANNQKEVKKMTKKGNLYSYAPIFYNFPLKYHIEYKDTNKVDLKDGEDYCVDTESLAKKITNKKRKECGLSYVNTLKEGKATGKLRYIKDADTKTLEAIKDPSIILTDCYVNNCGNNNILGIILIRNNIGTLCHFGSQIRNQTLASGVLYDDKTIENLKKLDGKNIEIEFMQDDFKFKKTDEIPKKRVFKKVFIPEIKSKKEPLTSNEFSLDYIGAKAVNLKRLEDMKKSGKIDVEIPNSVALPFECIESIIGKISQNTSCSPLDTRYNEDKHKEKIDYIKLFMQSNGIDPKKPIIVRSAFNGEDMKNCSAAGAYRSCLCSGENKDFYSAIRNVAYSKYSLDAITLRKNYQIDEESIKPGILINNNIPSEYKFTLYTDDGKGNMKLSLYEFTPPFYFLNDSIESNTFLFNKKTKEITYKSKQFDNCPATVDENGNIIDIELRTKDVKSDKKIYDMVKKLFYNASIIEKEFKSPQDIEGGFYKGDIYIWQTRNIVFE